MYTVAASASTGSFCFAVVAILDFARAGGPSDPWLGLALSTLVGLASKEQDKLVRAVLRTSLKRLGIKIEDVDG